MKILYKGVYRQCDGWGKASQGHVEALSRIKDVDLQITPILLSDNKEENLSPKFDELENNGIGKPNVFIQHVLPSHFEKIPGVFNIGSCVVETRNLKGNSWIENMNLMDAIWVPTELEVKILKDSGVSVPVQMIPHGLDTDRLDKAIEEEIFEDNFVFLFLGTLLERKNVQSLILAFCREFHIEEKVKLIVKTTHHSSQELLQGIQNMVNSFRLPAYSNTNITIVCDHQSDDQIANLQKSVDCLVVPSMGESTCIPLVECAYLGKNIICTKGIGAEDKNLKINTVNSMEVPCLCMNPPVPNIYTANETWMAIDVLDLQRNMRNIFENKPPVEDYNKNYIREHYGYQRVSETISQRLSELQI